MVDDIGQHGKDQVTGRGGAKAFERNADGDRNDIAAAKARDHAASHADGHAHQAGQALAKLIGQWHHKDRGNGHRDGTQHGQQRL